jgi:predicted dehydrogenase
MRMWRYAGEPGWFQPLLTGRLDAAASDPLARQLAHFCAVIRGEVAPLVSGRDAMRSLAATLAIHEAARRQCIVTLDGTSAVS